MKNILPALERILEAGNAAPSGENCQPWHFVVRGDIIEVHLLPERDQSAYGWGQRAAYLANGAVIENMVIAASAEKYRADVRYFPNASDVWHTANIALFKDDVVTPDPLVEFVSKRVSNRKPYKKDPLTPEQRQSFLSVAGEAHGSFAFVEDRKTVASLGRVGSTNEEVMLANRALHDFFFSHVSWTKDEDDQKKVGFYIKTLELPPPAQAMFKVFRNWSIMSVLARIGFTGIVAKQNGAVNAAAAGIGALMVEHTEPIDFVKAGRVVERLWLTATSMGLSLQPLTGVLFFKLRIAAGEAEVFSLGEKKRIMDAYEVASRAFNADGKHIAFMFRIGQGSDPSARAIRFPIADVVTVIP